MMRERLENAREIIMDKICSQMTDIDKVGTVELGLAIDMIKDLSEAIYYEVKMEESCEEEESK